MTRVTATLSERFRFYPIDTDTYLRELVRSQVRDNVPFACKQILYSARIFASLAAPPPGLKTDNYVRPFCRVISVRKLCDIAWSNAFVELAKRARALRDANSELHLFGIRTFASEAQQAKILCSVQRIIYVKAEMPNGGEVPDKPQSVKVHICARGYCDDRLVLHVMLLQIFLCARNAQCASRLQNHASILESVLYGCANL